MKKILDQKKTYSLQRRIQFLAATSVLVAGFFLVSGVWLIDHMLNHDRAAEAARSAVGFLQEIAQNPDDSSVPKEQLNEVMVRNPGAWYYYEDNSNIIQSNEGPPRFKQGLTGITAKLSINHSGESLCSERPNYFKFENDGEKAIVSSGGCGESAFYVEVVGINKDYSIFSHFREIIQISIFDADRLKDTIIPIFAMILITLVAIMYLFGTLTRRVKDISAAASNIGAGESHILLPEDNLPREVLPIVQAANTAISRLESASEKQALFVAASAHELRTPLTVLRTRLEDITDEKLKTALVEDVKRMSAMMSQLLALAKLGATEADLKKLNLGEVVRSVCRDRGVSVYRENKVLEFDASDKPSDIVGDKETITSAIANLIDNAMQFTPKGKSVYVVVDGPIVKVSDRGPGIPETDLKKIFEPFFKNPPNKQGHGLGLAIVAEIMQIHNGSAEVHNRAEGGAEFELSFQSAA